MKQFWQDYSLSITLFVLFSVTWAVQLYAQYKLAQSGWEMVASTTENWQSEFLQLLAFVTLTAFLRHKGSPESKE